MAGGGGRDVGVGARIFPVKRGTRSEPVYDRDRVSEGRLENKVFTERNEINLSIYHLAQTILYFMAYR